MSQIVDGYVFMHGDKLYNLFTQGHSGDIIKELNIGDILYVHYDMEAAEGAWQDAQDRVSEWDDLDLEPCELTNILPDLEIVPLLSVIDYVSKMSLVVEAAYLC